MAATTNQLRQQIEQISREKNINPEVIIAAIEDAILTASKKYYKNNEDLRSRFNNETGQIEVFAVRQIVETVETPETQIGLDEARKLIPEAEVGQEIEFPKPTDILGRIAAQTAKQVIFQKVREAERDNVFAEYSGRVGEVVNGIIKRQEMGDFIVDLGRAEAILPRKEQSRAETYQTGDRVRVAIAKVLKSAKGPQVVVSRTDPALLIKLFEMEVPEIYDGTVQIKGCVREAGERAKVAVISREKDVDPVGACVGMKGTRVQSIIRELRGEKIDIVEWSEDPTQFVMNALSPAKVSRVSVIDEEQKIMEVVVEDKQLSLAIGKKGQNVRLAAKIVGWRIDIKSEEEKRQEVEAEMARMARIVDELRSLQPLGVSDKIVQKLIDVGRRRPGPPARDDGRGAGDGRGHRARRPWRRSARRPWRPSSTGTAATPRKRPAWRPSASRPSGSPRSRRRRWRPRKPRLRQPPKRRRPRRPKRARRAGSRRSRRRRRPRLVRWPGKRQWEGSRMVNVRVFQLARDLELPSQEVIDRLKKLGVDVKTASSSVDEDTADKLKRAFKIDALTARKRRIYGSEEDEAEREQQEQALAARIAAEKEAREQAAAEAAAAAEARKRGKSKAEAAEKQRDEAGRRAGARAAARARRASPGSQGGGAAAAADRGRGRRGRRRGGRRWSRPKRKPRPAATRDRGGPRRRSGPCRPDGGGSAAPVSACAPPRVSGPLRPIAPPAPPPPPPAPVAPPRRWRRASASPAASAAAAAPARPARGAPSAAAPMARHGPSDRARRAPIPPRPVGPHPTAANPVVGRGAAALAARGHPQRPGMVSPLRPVSSPLPPRPGGPPPGMRPAIPPGARPHASRPPARPCRVPAKASVPSTPARRARSP